MTEKNIIIQSDPKLSYGSIVKNPSLLLCRENYYIREFVEIIGNDRQGGAFLEVGFGNGRLLEAMSKQYPSARFVGLEVRAKPVETMKAKGYDCHLVDKELFDISERFDVIYGSAILHHTENPAQYLCHLFDILNPGGLLVFHNEAHRFDVLSMICTTLYGTLRQDLNMFKLSKNICNDLKDKSTSCSCRYNGNPVAAMFPRMNKIYRKLCLHRIPFFNVLTIVIQK
jgi:2-polyprenyl-3-methyl-5-hydroxy-6-metoxy-1,4-benzoquinol methylase